MLRLCAILAVLFQSVGAVFQPRPEACCAADTARCCAGGSCCDSGADQPDSCCGGDSGSESNCGRGEHLINLCRLISTDRSACLLAQLTGLCDGCECCPVEDDAALLLPAESASKKGILQAAFPGRAASYPLLTATRPSMIGEATAGDAFRLCDHRRRSVLNVWTI